MSKPKLYPILVLDCVVFDAEKLDLNNGGHGSGLDTSGLGESILTSGLPVAAGPYSFLAGRRDGSLIHKVSPAPGADKPCQIARGSSEEAELINNFHYGRHMQSPEQAVTALLFEDADPLADFSGTWDVSQNFLFPFRGKSGAGYPMAYAREAISSSHAQLANIALGAGEDDMIHPVFLFSRKKLSAHERLAHASRFRPMFEIYCFANNWQKRFELQDPVIV